MITVKMTDVNTGEYSALTVHVGQVAKPYREMLGKPLYFEIWADGDELYAILAKIENFPMTTGPVKYWSGDLAKMAFMAICQTATIG